MPLIEAYTITTKPFGKFEQLCVNHQSGSGFTIIPGFGAVLNELVLVKDQTAFSVIDGHTTDAMLLENQWFRSAKLTPFPNRVNSGRYTFMGKLYQLPVNFAPQHHAIHGLVFNLPFTCTGSSISEHQASVSLQLHYTGNIQGYPFPFLLQLVYVLQEQNRFTCTTTFTNTGAAPLPFADGWHPYFTLGSQTVNQLFLRLPACRELQTNPLQIPTGQLLPYSKFEQLTPIGNTELDTGFAILPQPENTATTTLFNATENLTLNIWQQVKPNSYNYLQIFTPPHRQSIAIEPMTAAPDCFNNGMGLQMLQPGAIFTASYGVVLQ
ncbi:aldose 1-epimerase [Sphingobacteriales bacterium UPWRP_1]|nr:hypothetical protein BVG80_00480 [Sphingobacteriales bacterium TSM_CSM]PSJ72025.1 aldose 1-epimerase [Sphingobacteriales bacterium UPWRP_1]